MSVLMQIVLFVFGIAFFLYMYKYYKSQIELEWAYDRYMTAYRLKVLEQDLKKEGLTFSDLDKYTLKYQGMIKSKPKQKSDLQMVRDSVRGEVKNTSPLKTSDKK